MQWSLPREGTDFDQTAMKATGSSSRERLCRTGCHLCVHTCAHVRRRLGPWAGLRKGVRGGDLVRAVCQEEKPRETVGGRGRGHSRKGQGARCLLQETPGARSAQGSPGWEASGGPPPTLGTYVSVCMGHMRAQWPRRPLMVRSEGRGSSLAPESTRSPTCRLPTAHSGPELDRGCSDFQERERP